MEIILRHPFSECEFADRKFAVDGKRGDRSEAVVGFFGNSHIFPFNKPDIYIGLILSIL